MQMRVDEARHQHLSRDVDLTPTVIAGADAHDAVAADGDVALDPGASDHAPDLTTLQDQIGGNLTLALCDAVFDGHAVPFCW